MGILTVVDYLERDPCSNNLARIGTLVIYLSLLFPCLLYSWIARSSAEVFAANVKKLR